MPANVADLSFHSGRDRIDRRAAIASLRMFSDTADSTGPE